MDNTESNSLELPSQDTDNECLDSLLDDALEDFNKPITPKRPEAITGSLPLSDDASNTSAWTEEFIKHATQNFEVTMKSILDHQKASTDENEVNTPNVDLQDMSAEFTKFAEIAAKAASESSSDQDFTNCLAETMKQIAQNNEEAQAVPTGEELGKMFEQLGLGDMSMLGQGSENEGIGGFFPLMQTMLENILSKDVLYHPMKEIVSKYPDWLADNRSKLLEADYDQYNKQYGVMKTVVDMFESEKEDDTEEQKAQNFEAILKLMQKLQDYGQPPQELVGDQTPIINFDEHGNPQLPDLSTLFGAAGFPTFGGSDNSEIDLQNIPNNLENGPAQPQGDSCSIM